MFSNLRLALFHQQIIYAATDDLNSSDSGCAGVVLAMTLITFALVWTLVH